MIMDIIVFAILIATIFFSMRRGFALTLANFFGGIVSVVIGWIFSDDLAEILFKETFVGTWLTDKLHDGLVQSWQNSEIYQALPSLLRKESNSGTANGSTDRKLVFHVFNRNLRQRLGIQQMNPLILQGKFVREVDV